MLESFCLSAIQTVQFQCFIGMMITTKRCFHSICFGPKSFIWRQKSPLMCRRLTNPSTLANRRRNFNQSQSSRQSMPRRLASKSGRRLTNESALANRKSSRGEISTNHRALACRCCLDSFKMAILEKSKQKIGLRKSWSVHNFAFKCPILKCSSCSRDQATAKTRL